MSISFLTHEIVQVLCDYFRTKETQSNRSKNPDPGLGLPKGRYLNLCLRKTPARYEMLSSFCLLFSDNNFLIGVN
jgi:hypothetical protein